MPKKFLSSGLTVNSEGYTPLTVAGKVTNLFLPRLSFIVTGLRYTPCTAFFICCTLEVGFIIYCQYCPFAAKLCAAAVVLVNSIIVYLRFPHALRLVCGFPKRPLRFVFEISPLATLGRNDIRNITVVRSRRRRNRNGIAIVAHSANRVLLRTAPITSMA